MKDNSFEKLNYYKMKHKIKMIVLKIVIAIIIWLFSTVLLSNVLNIFGNEVTYLAPQIGFLISGFSLYYLFEKNLKWHLGLKDSTFPKSMYFGYILGSLFVLFPILILLLTDNIIFHLNGYNIKNFILQLLIFTMVALGEEFFFRGYIYGLFQHNYNTKTAIVVNSILFALLHLINPEGFDKPVVYIILEIINISILGYLFSVTRFISRAIWMPFGFHMIFNIFQSSIFGFTNGGKKVDSILHLTINENNIWNGGIYGLESSFMLTLFLFFSIIFSVQYLNKNKERLKTTH